jgi:hypothetical protein
MTLRVLATLAAGAFLATSPIPSVSTPPAHPAVFPANSSPYGQDYAEWSADWWTWLLQHPMPGHPAIDDPAYDVTSGQSGNVWFLSTIVDGLPHTRKVTVPQGKALFVGLLNYEMSSQEGAATEAEQREIANFWADHIVDVKCAFDGVPVDLTDFRFESEQFAFTAPNPWIFSPAPSGPGTAVADGYYVCIKPLSPGKHVLRIKGRFHFEANEIGNPAPIDFPAETTYLITVQ